MFTPEAPKQTSRVSRRPLGDVPTKRRKIQLSPEQAATLLSSSLLIDSSSYINKYFDTLRILGEGDFGEVKEVQSKQTSEKFAIKIFKVDKMKVKSGLNYTKTNLDEIRAHMSLPPHPNLIQFYQAWKEDGYLYMQMELSQYSLDGYWRMKNKLTLKDLEDVTVDCLQALKHLESHNIAHLDIKPQNILRSENGVYKLADFSVTIDLNKADTSSSEFGTGRFAAPELLNGIFSTKADLYSLGISLSQVCVPSDAQLKEDEWTSLKEKGLLPTRVLEALSGPFGLAAMVQSMIHEHSSRPSAEELLPEDSREFDFECEKHKNSSLRRANKALRLSLPASCEKELRESKSPIVGASQKSSVIFHTDEKFFEMERPTRQRYSMESRRPIRFQLEDD